MQGSFEQRIVQLDAFRLGKAGQRKNVAMRHTSSALPHADCVGADAEGFSEDHPASEGSDQLVYGGDGVHGDIYSLPVSGVKRDFSEQTLHQSAEIIDLMVRIVSNQPIDIPGAPPPDVDAIFERLSLCAAQAGMSLSAACDVLGFTSARLFNHKDRATVPAMEMLRAFKRRFGVTIDWIVEGDDSGLTYQARQFLDLK